MDFFLAHWLDITTTLLGLAYILLEVRISLWLFLVGFLMEALDVVLYYDYGLYADCAMEFYYIFMTVYGFINWKWGAGQQKKELPITHFPRRFILPWAVGVLAAWALIYFLLTRYTDSTVPLADSFTTAFSLLGAWALARKYVEQWIVWIAVDAVCFALYAYKGLPFKSGLYGLYTLLAIFGYWKWLRQMRQTT